MLSSLQNCMLLSTLATKSSCQTLERVHLHKMNVNMKFSFNLENFSHSLQTHCIIVLPAWYTKSEWHVQFFSSSSHNYKDRETLWQYSEYILPPPPPLPLPPSQLCPFSHPPPLLSPFSPLPLSSSSPSSYDDRQYSEYTSGTFIMFLGSRSLSGISFMISGL